ncbi:diacylglycerol kinase [Aerococcus sanguinicola]|uniref:diacylglycerol kinase n=1 Tax=unclassified Aerococcus TaxID=2618060 RepID=UPI0008BC8A28|nr:MULTISPECIES: diacylglycerol kinase family protein [unclassified Aerococcus]MDK6233597.1 diacylglycerol kinase family protein [Aerococcus sp. UMB10185]MDK6804193.1 diacylglycerol kinase family protein [Aerococcus sp. UMB7834]MDK6855720.1 diacylglycerol kinase family protein [Aerococcus sp. UMB7533]MDK8501473.1 diacylglycerol kinase family protein [Aerococcus sp. UMB1112A]OFN01367.1 hypothetical protein HMPREF2626_07480 [Aerococcus sp. HMSC062A02]
MDSNDQNKEQVGKNRHFLGALGHAHDGLRFALHHERNFRFQLAMVPLLGALGLYLGLKPTEWALLALACGLVLLAELFNTSVEWLCDLVVGDHFHPLVKTIKDVAAGSVLLMTLVAIFVGFVIFGSYIL